MWVLKVSMSKDSAAVASPLELVLFVALRGQGNGRGVSPGDAGGVPDTALRRFQRARAGRRGAGSRAGPQWQVGQRAGRWRIVEGGAATAEALAAEAT